MSSRPSPTSEIEKRFPGLAVLAGNYVNNAWDYLHGSPQAAVLAFSAEEPELRASAAAGIDELVQALATEGERRAALLEMGWGYGGVPGTLDEFLKWTRMTLLEAMA